MLKMKEEAKMCECDEIDERGRGGVERDVRGSEELEGLFLSSEAVLEKER